MFFVESNYDEQSGISKVTVKHKGKFYEGVARLHPEEECPSKFAGCRYAELRAEIAALKTEHKEKKSKCEECRKFVNAVMCYASFDKDSPSAKAMFRQLNRRIKEVNNLADEINQKELELRMTIKGRDVFRKRMESRKAKND